MPKVKYTRKAIQDLSNIWEYTLEKWSEKQADKYYQELKNNCQTIIKNPESGRTYFDLENNLRRIKVNKHIIFYRTYENQNIEITRILHERMDLKRTMKNNRT